MTIYSSPDYLYPQQSTTNGLTSIFPNGFIPERYNSTSSPIISKPKDEGMNSSTKVDFSSNEKTEKTIRKSKDKE